ncbi:hypothetical protein [Litorivivens sp.]|uniref:hypothetical protein n=1 Tax=Litorivivens sp. TaxID=2020868 RepID=UPI0035647651
MKLLLLIPLLLLTACSQLSTVHYVNQVAADYGAPATGYRDTDGDGVMDFGDVCPRTAIGATVTEYGCELRLVDLTEDKQCPLQQDRLAQHTNNELSSRSLR